jgi:hypothetical protein
MWRIWVIFPQEILCKRSNQPPSFSFFWRSRSEFLPRKKKPIGVKPILAKLETYGDHEPQEGGGWLYLLLKSGMDLMPTTYK